MHRGGLAPRIAIMLASAPLLLGGGCATSELKSLPAPAEPRASQVTTDSTQSQPAQPATSPAGTSSGPGTAEAVDAEKAFERIADSVQTARLVKVYTEDDDPNKLLGRPNGYTSKIAFSDSRIPKKDVEFVAKDAIERGGSIEVFPDAAGAEARAKYIQNVLKSGGLGSEYDYVKGPVLLRVTGDLSPRRAKEYLGALD